MSKVYYYKTANGDFHFSTGVVRNEAKACEYIRMLRYAKKCPECLYPDSTCDYELICKNFGFPKGTPWQDIYNGKV